MKIKKSLSLPVNEADVMRLESHIGATLPNDYREFLLKTNGGVPDRPYFSLPKVSCGYGDSAVRYFLGLTEKPNIDLIHNFDIYVSARRVPSNMLPIAADPGGNIVVLAVTGGDKGKVYFWNHEMECLELESSSNNSLIFVARSFTTFIENLKAEPQS